MSDSQADPEPFLCTQFSGRVQSIIQFRNAALEFLPKTLRPRILDLGCGTGDLLFDLARHRSNLSLTGIDISSVNIQTAKQRNASEPLLDNLAFLEGDYFRWQAPAFDVILAESVLHLLAGDTTRLVSKLAADLVPGGLLIATMPHRCLVNTLLIFQRRLWKAMPPALDTIAAATGKRIYPSEPSYIIEERVRYLRIVPARLFDKGFAARLKCAGLDLVENQPWPRSSILKPKHRFLVFRRRSTPN